MTGSFCSPWKIHFDWLRLGGQFQNNSFVGEKNIAKFFLIMLFVAMVEWFGIFFIRLTYKSTVTIDLIIRNRYFFM